MNIINNCGNELKEMVADVESKVAPKRFLMNCINNCVHRVLTTFDEAGPMAKTRCGWKYSNSQVKMVCDPTGTEADACDTC